MSQYIYYIPELNILVESDFSDMSMLYFERNALYETVLLGEL